MQFCRSIERRKKFGAQNVRHLNHGGFKVKLKNNCGLAVATMATNLDFYRSEICDKSICCDREKKKRKRTFDAAFELLLWNPEVISQTK